jgi:hypothetical protein
VSTTTLYLILSTILIVKSHKMRSIAEQIYIVYWWSRSMFYTSSSFRSTWDFTTRSAVILLCSRVAHHVIWKEHCSYLQFLAPALHHMPATQPPSFFLPALSLQGIFSHTFTEYWVFLVPPQFRFAHVSLAFSMGSLCTEWTSARIGLVVRVWKQMEEFHDAKVVLLMSPAICASTFYCSMNVWSRISSSFTLNKASYYVFSFVKQGSES